MPGDHIRTRPRRRAGGAALLTAVLLTVALLASACGGSDDESSSSGDSTDTTEGSGTPVRGGEVVYGLEAETSNGWCLPEGQLAMSGIMVARAIYDTLTVPNEDGDFVPFLAESIEPNEDNTEWEITLRDGVTFHDGSPLTAAVVKNNLDAYRGEYPNRQPLLLRFILDPISDVGVTGDLTLTVTTDVPWPALPANLFSSGRLGIVAQSQLDDQETCDSKLVGTGPFVQEEWRINDQFSATANPDYWLTDTEGNQLPYLDRIAFRPVIDSQSRSNSLLSGQLDAMITAGASATEILEEEEADGGIALVQSDEYPEVGYLILNSDTPPFDNRNARLAVSHGVDRDLLNEVRSLDMFQVADGPFGPDSPGYVEDPGFPEYDLEKSREYQEAYKAETGEDLRFTFTHQADPETLQTAQFLQDQLEKAGIPMDFATLEQATLISTAISGDYESLSMRNHPGGDPDTAYVWWYGGSPLNFGNIDDPEINDLMDRARSETNPDERVRLYEEVNREFAAEAYNLWQSWVQWSIGTQPGVHGVMGPDLPDGSGPFPGLAEGHSLAGMWREN